MLALLVDKGLVLDFLTAITSPPPSESHSCLVSKDLARRPMPLALGDWIAAHATE